MTDKILPILEDIEQKYNIKIIFAVESGSRVWGMDSPDSDYDLRGVYIELDDIQNLIDCGAYGIAISGLITRSKDKKHLLNELKKRMSYARV